MSVEQPLEEPSQIYMLDVGFAFDQAGGTLPAFIEFEGRKLVLITHAEFAELAAARSKVLLDAVRGGRSDAPRPPKLGLSTIERDPEVADWLRGRFQGGVTVEQLHAACVEAFGTARTPSPARITRFRLKVRRSR